MVLTLAHMFSRWGRIRLLARRRSLGTRAISVAAISPVARMNCEDDPDSGLAAAGTRRGVEGPGGERDGNDEQQGLDGPARRGRDGAGAHRRPPAS